MAGNARSLTRNANQLCFNLLSVNLSLHTFSNTLCTRGAPPKAKLLLRKRRHTPRELYCRRPHPRLAHVPALWRDHRRHRHALLGSAVAMDRREGLALRPRPAGLLALAGKPVWNTRAASQSISARRPRLEAALARARSSAGGACAGGRMFRPIGRGPWAATLDSGADHIWMATRRPCVSGSISCMFSTPDRIVG